MKERQLSLKVRSPVGGPCFRGQLCSHTYVGSTNWTQTVVSKESKAEAMKLGGGSREQGWILEELWGGVEEYGQRTLGACMRFSKN